MANKIVASGNYNYYKMLEANIQEYVLPFYCGVFCWICI